MNYKKTLKYKDIHPEYYGPREINPGNRFLVRGKDFSRKQMTNVKKQMTNSREKITRGNTLQIRENILLVR